MSPECLGRVLCLFGVLSLAGCYAPKCPKGYTPKGGRCLTLDTDASMTGAGEAGVGNDGAAQGMDGGDGADASEEDAACPILPFFSDVDGDGHGDPAARVDACEAPDGYVALGDDCDDGCAECKPGGTGMCMVSNANFACTTSCGSIGVGTCSASCDQTCVVPTESCNYSDDDCDGAADEALRTLSMPTTDKGKGERSWVFADGAHPMVFIQERPTFDGDPSELRVRRLEADGTPAATDAKVLSAVIQSKEYALTSTGPNIVIVWAETDPAKADNRFLRASIISRADLSVVVAPRTIGEGPEFLYPSVAASASNVLVAYTEKEHVERIATDGMLQNETFPLWFDDSRAGRPFVFAPRGAKTWLLAYPLLLKTGDTVERADLVLQRVDPTGTAIGKALRLSETPSSTEDAPWIAEDGQGNIGITFTVIDTGVLRLLLYKLADLGGADVQPYADVSVPARIVPAVFMPLRPSSLAFTRGYWTVVHAAQFDSPKPGVSTQVQARMFDPTGALTFGGSPLITIAEGALDLALGADVGAMDNGITVFTAPYPLGNVYARWGCF